MQMNHEDLARRLEERLDKIEIKLDRYLEIIAGQEADLRWVRGYIRLSLAAGLAFGGGLLSVLAKLYLV